MSPSRKTSYEDAFSGRTKAILRTLSNIILDSGLDVRTKQMFGHKALLLNGRPFLLIGEWARDERPAEDIVTIRERGREEPTLIVIPLDEPMAQEIRAMHGGLYFAPKGSRLKFWISLTGPWLGDEEAVQPLILRLLEAYSQLPMKQGVANPGRRV